MRNYRICFMMFLTVIIFGFFTDNRAFAAEVVNNESTGYVAIIDDDANLLTDEQEQKLTKTLEEITKYGNVAFYSSYDNYNSVEYLAESYYIEHFGRESGVVFVIDMNNRELYFFTDGDIGDYLTVSYCNIIADNIYRYATDGEYYKCASQGYQQILTLLEGKSIAKPMQHISNAIIAVCLAMIVAFLIAMATTRSQKATVEQEIGAMYRTCTVYNPYQEFVGQTKKYSPKSNGSGGGSHGGGGGGHGGGHSF